MIPHRVSECCGASARNDMEEEMERCSSCGENSKYVEEDNE
jgi:hypothetical protein